MSLLESIVALVILGLAATGFLEIFQQSGRSSRDADAWLGAVAYAEEGVEAAKIGGSVLDESRSAVAPPRLRRTIEQVPFKSNVSEIVVTVYLDDGRRLVVRRLKESR